MVMRERERRDSNTFSFRTDSSAAGITPNARSFFSGMTREIIDNYYTYETLQTEHIANSHAQILATADRALSRVPKGKKKTALILGAGPCLDIPLEELDFDTITLFDLDGKGLKEVAKSLDNQTRQKVRIVVGDVTGIISGTTQSIDKVAAASPTLSRFYQGLRETSIGAKPSEINIREPSTFVCSQLLMSQLGYSPLHYLEHVMQQRYDHQFSVSNPNDAAIYHSYLRLGHGLVNGHINFLHNLVDPQGSVHFADTYMRIAKGTNGQNDVRPMMNRPSIEPRIFAHFNGIGEPKTWIWQHSPHQSFRVVSHSLDPKNFARS